QYVVHEPAHGAAGPHPGQRAPDDAPDSRAGFPPRVRRLRPFPPRGRHRDLILTIVRRRSGRATGGTPPYRGSRLPPFVRPSGTGWTAHLLTRENIMWLKWLPWKYIVRQAARRRGFIDPIALMARFNALSQPAETAAPLELLRAGAVLHARGFLNNNVIQHNLDWVWPYWVDRQFDPTSPAFIPRAFSMTHINLTQRNWTAVGYPGCPETPLVDARGLLMPFFDSWSIDAWFLADDGTTIIPSRMKTVRQSLSMGETGDALRVETVSTSGKAVLRSTVEVVVAEGEPRCRADYTVDSPVAGWLVVSVRPYNPEGVSFVNDISLLTRDEGWEINQTRTVHFSRPPDEHLLSRYRDGDVYLAIREGRFNRRAHIRCE